MKRKRATPFNWEDAFSSININDNMGWGNPSAQKQRNNGFSNTNKRIPLQNSEEDDDERTTAEVTSSNEEEGDEANGGEAVEQTQFNKDNVVRLLKTITSTPARTSRATAEQIAAELPRRSINDHFNDLYFNNRKQRVVFDSNDSSLSDDEEEEDDELAMADHGQRKRSRQYNPNNNTSVPVRKNHGGKGGRGGCKGKHIECFLCAWGDLYHDGIKAKHVNKLNDIMKNYGGCSNEDLAQMLHLYFKRFVYKENKGMTMLTAEIALEHIEEHVLASDIFIGESIRLFKKIRYSIASRLFYENGRFDRHEMTAIINVQKMLNTLMGLNQANLNFNQGRGRQDMNKIGNYFNIMPLFKQKKQKDERGERVMNMFIDEFDL